MFQIPADQIGGAVVRRTFSSRGKRLISGTRLSAAEVLAFPQANRNALSDKHYIDLFPKGGVDSSVSASGERFVISAGFGRFYVIEGKKLNDDPLDREQAYALAGTQAPPKPGRKKKEI